eukprot:1171630-Rhodomonas_salina.3
MTQRARLWRGDQDNKTTRQQDLGDGVVGAAHGLEALVAADADADVGLGDHGHVVGAVADGERHGLGLHAVAHHAHDLPLLVRRDPARDHRLAQLRPARAPPSARRGPDPKGKHKERTYASTPRANTRNRRQRRREEDVRPWRGRGGPR